MAEQAIPLSTFLDGRYQRLEEDGPGARADALVTDGSGGIPKIDSPWAVAHYIICGLVLLALAAGITAAVLGGVFGSDNKDLNEDILDCLQVLKNITGTILNNTFILINTTSTILNNTETLIGGQEDILDCLAELKNGTCTLILQSDMPKIINESGCYRFGESLEWIAPGEVAIEVAASFVELHGDGYNLTVGDDQLAITFTAQTGFQGDHLSIYGAGGAQLFNTTGIFIGNARHVTLQDIYLEGMTHGIDIFGTTLASVTRAVVMDGAVGAVPGVTGLRSSHSQGVLLYDSVFNLTSSATNSTCISQGDSTTQGMVIERTTAVCRTSGLSVFRGQGVTVQSSYFEAVTSPNIACLIGSPDVADMTTGTTLRSTTCVGRGRGAVGLWAANALSLLVDKCTVNVSDPGLFVNSLRIGTTSLNVTTPSKETVIVQNSIVLSHPTGGGVFIDQVLGSTYVRDSHLEGGEVAVYITGNGTTLKDNTVAGGSVLGVWVESEVGGAASNNVLNGNRIVDNCGSGLVFGTASSANIAYNNFITGNEASAIDLGALNLLSNQETGNNKDCAPIVVRRSARSVQDENQTELMYLLSRSVCM